MSLTIDTSAIEAALRRDPIVSFETPFGRVILDPSLPEGTAEFRDPITGKVLARIVNIGREHPDAHPILGMHCRR